MALKPRMAVKVLRADGSVRWLPIFYAKVDQVIGLNADWFKIYAENKNNENDWLIGEIDTLQFIIYMGYSHKSLSAGLDAVVPDLSPMIHGWVGDSSATFGSVGKMISIEGGDASFVFNKGYSGDFMARRTPTEKAKPLEDSFIPAENAWGIIKIVTRAEKKEGKWITPEGIELVPSDSFMNDKKEVGGMTKPEYFPDTITEEERKKLQGVSFYQINNQSKLEVIDDVCSKSGYYATVDPGTNRLRIGRKEDFPPEKISPLKSWGGSSTLDEKQVEKGSWVKFEKVPHFENGLQLEINYWNWEKDVYGSHADGKKRASDDKYLVKGRAHFVGNVHKDAVAIVWTQYEPVSRESANRRAYKAVNRIVSQRVIASGQVPGNPDLIPNRLVPIEGCGRWSGGDWNGEYLATHTSHAFSRAGYSTLFNIRLPDLKQTRSDEEATRHPFTTAKIGDFVKIRAGLETA